MSELAESLLAAIAQSTPASPLRFADAEELNPDLTWGEGYRKIKGGNDLLPRAMARDVEVRLDRPVRVIGWRTSGVTVETDRETLHADRVLVTVPGPLVSELGFDPVLPDSKVRAHLQLHYGNGLRIIMQYAERKMVREAIGSGCFTNRLPGFILEQTLHQGGDKIVVSGLAAGDAEPAFETDEQILDGVDATMSSVVGRPLTRVFGYVKSWTRDPWSRAVVRGADRRPARERAALDRSTPRRPRLLRGRAHRAAVRPRRHGGGHQIRLSRGIGDPGRRVNTQGRASPGLLRASAAAPASLARTNTGRGSSK